MCRVMATYPLAQMARITATARNAAGMLARPVVAYAVGMTPAATVSGATPARTKNSTAGTPSRSRASARDMVLGLLPAICVLDILWLQGLRRFGIGAAVTRGGRAGRCPLPPGSGRSGPAGRDQAGRPPLRGGGGRAAAG